MICKILLHLCSCCVPISCHLSAMHLFTPFPSFPIPCLSPTFPTCWCLRPSVFGSCLDFWINNNWTKSPLPHPLPILCLEFNYIWSHSVLYLRYTFVFAVSVKPWVLKVLGLCLIHPYIPCRPWHIAETMEILLSLHCWKKSTTDLNF